MKINKEFANLKESYLFSEIAKRVNDYKKNNPDKTVISLGIGDVTRPIPTTVIDALKKASDEMLSTATFRGYGPEQGYDFLREKIKEYYAEKNVDLDLKEIFISDGAKSDLGNVLDIFGPGNLVLITDPVYPVYVDTNCMNNNKVVFLNATADNKFSPLPDESITPDIIYLCSPNNPTGACYDYESLAKWVDYAKRKNSIILYDAAYEAFIVDRNIPRSIYEIEGAKDCAIEFSSLSKTAGFTGLRCGYTVVPQGISCEGLSYNKLWTRRQTTKFNGVSYVIQRAAEAVFTKEGRAEIKENLEYYKKNAKAMVEFFTENNIWFTGGVNSPYLWIKIPNGMSSWDFFDLMLTKANVVGTPGVGFGANGEGFFRLTSFNTYENTIEALKRIKSIL